MKWNVDTVAQILKNEVYIGNLVQGKKTSMGYKVHKFKKVPEKDWCRTENAHEPIIDIDTWNKVQKRLGTHESPTKTGEIHYFSRKVYCECCGKVFMRNVYNVKNEKTGKRAYLQCKGAKRYHECDNNKAIRLDELEEIILNAINDLLTNYYDKNNLQEQYNIRIKQDTTNKQKVQTLEKEKSILEKKINDNKGYFRELYEDKAKGNITEDMFRMMTNDYSKEIEEYTNRINIINTEITELEKQKEDRKQADEILKKYKKINKLNKIIIDEFIDKIYIGTYDKETKTRDIEIEWNFEF